MKEDVVGPWKAEQPENAGGWWVVCDRDSIELGSTDGGFEKHQAVLMAAAPEMRDLLRETLLPGEYGVGSTLAQRIEAVLAKAMMSNVQSQGEDTSAACGRSPAPGG